jgi:hypothetical protein
MLRRFVGLGFRTNRLILVSTAIILSLLSLSFTPAPRSYLESLVTGWHRLLEIELFAVHLRGKAPSRL